MIKGRAEGKYRNLWSKIANRIRFLFISRPTGINKYPIYMPLGQGVICPIVAENYWNSFREIFRDHAYGDILDQVGVVDTWIDIGSHGGFFSLNLILNRKLKKQAGKISALLIDADERVKRSIDMMVKCNKLEDNVTFVHGAISSFPDVEFYERDEMASSALAVEGMRQNIKKVKAISDQDIIRLLPPPYDLLKIDIEGSEYDFLKNYPAVLTKTNLLILEWHSWNPKAPGGKKDILNMAIDRGFEMLLDSPEKSLIVNGKPATCGVCLLKNTAYR